MIDADASTTLTPTGDGKVSFIGNYSPETLNANDKSSLYLGAENQLYWPTADRTINAFRGYFHVDLSGGGYVREIRLNLDSTTGVESVNGYRLSVIDDDGWYTLQGVKLSGKPTQKGIYIHDGKKVMMP